MRVYHRRSQSPRGIGSIPTGNKIFVTIRNVVSVRLCFHRHLSFCSGGCVYPSMHWGRHPPRPLKRMLPILLECILVEFIFLFTTKQYIMQTLPTLCNYGKHDCICSSGVSHTAQWYRNSYSLFDIHCTCH